MGRMLDDATTGSCERFSSSAKSFSTCQPSASRPQLIRSWDIQLWPCTVFDPGYSIGHGRQLLYLEVAPTSDEQF